MQEKQIMNTFLKYAPNVFVAKCTERHAKGDVITMTSKYGKESEYIVHNFIMELKDGTFVYSITRADGRNFQDFAREKAERVQSWQNTAMKKSDEKWKQSHEGRDFLALAEPIKVGHHSERKHRALIQRNHDRMDKAMEFQKKAESYEGKKQYWEGRASEINLSMPESIEYWEYKLEQAKEYHEGLKSGKYKRDHSYSLTYAKKAVNEAEKNYQIAYKLWRND